MPQALKHVVLHHIDVNRCILISLIHSHSYNEHIHRLQRIISLTKSPGDC